MCSISSIASSSSGSTKSHSPSHHLRHRASSQVRHARTVRDPTKAPGPLPCVTHILIPTTLSEILYLPLLINPTELKNPSPALRDRSLMTERGGYKIGMLSVHIFCAPPPPPPPRPFQCKTFYTLPPLPH